MSSLDTRPRNFSVRESFTSEAKAEFAGTTYIRDFLCKEQGAPAAKTAAATLTAAELYGGLITISQNTTATVALTLPTGAELDAALDHAGLPMSANDSFDFTIINLDTNAAANTATLTAGASGISIVGAAVIPSAHSTTVQNSARTFRCRKTAANTFVIYALN